MISTIDFDKYQRFFAFGCSFTRYWWPTWANFIAEEIPQSYNYGLCGAGNHFIFNSIVYAVKKFNIQSGDLVIVMWTNVMREDRYINKKWITPGNIYSQSYYDECFMKYVDERGFLIRDLAYISAVNLILQGTGCDYDNLSMVPISHIHNYDSQIKGDHDLLDNFSDLLGTIKPSVFETMYDNDWTKPINGTKNAVTMFEWQDKQFQDYHPVSQTHFDYLNKIYGTLNWKYSTMQYLSDINNQLAAGIVKDAIGRTSSPAIISGPSLGNV